MWVRVMEPRSMLIHIVEDDTAVCDSLSLLLSESGCDVVAHFDAESFFAAVPPSADDMVFVDLLLPGISGATVVRWLQSLKQPPRIVVMSGQSQRIIDHELNGLEPPRVLRKPLTRDDVSAQLRVGCY
jgi:FixJ family two-component response regulator